MKKLVIAALTLSLLYISQTAAAQSEADMKAMMAYATPGDIHKMMAKSAGSWTCSIQMWMEPGSAPTSSTAEAKCEMILGGRYLQSTNTGNFMGMPFEGISLTGYDNAKKVFVQSWIDNMGTGIMFLNGTWDQSTKSINFKGTMVDPASGKDVPLRQTVTFVDDDHQTMEMYAVMGSKEFKTMEIKYTRK